MLLTYVMSVCLVVALSDGLRCPERQNTCNDGGNIVAFCVRRKEDDGDHCNRELLSQVYEYPADCSPARCPARVRDHCSPNPCQHGGACHGFPGSYSCRCARGYRGRDCADQGDTFSSNVYFIYDPVAGWRTDPAGVLQPVVRSKAMIFLTSVDEKTSLVFTAGCSAFVKIRKRKKDVAIDLTAREKCMAEFADNVVVRTKFCQYLPRVKMPYFKLFYEIPFDHTNEPPGSLTMSYNRNTHSNMAGFKSTTLSVAVYNGEAEEFKESFPQISILLRDTGSECLSAVNLL